MCYNCGCKMPYADHGDAKNVVESDIEASAKTEAMGDGDKTTAKQNIVELINIQRQAGELEKPKENYNQ